MRQGTWLHPKKCLFDTYVSLAIDKIYISVAFWVCFLHFILWSDVLCIQVRTYMQNWKLSFLLKWLEHMSSTPVWGHWLTPGRNLFLKASCSPSQDKAAVVVLKQRGSKRQKWATHVATLSTGEQEHRIKPNSHQGSMATYGRVSNTAG